jgi:hypothetical protein
VTLARLGTFHLVMLGWVFFRAPSLHDAVVALGRLATPGYLVTRGASQAGILVGLAVLLHLAPDAARVRARFVRLPPTVQGVAYATATIAAFFVAPATERFIYFQF